MAAKLLEEKNRRVSDSAESHYRTRSGGKDKATDASSRTTHYGVPQVPAKTTITTYLPLSSQRRHSATSSGKFYQTIGTVNNLNHQGEAHRLSVSSGARGHSHHSRENSHRVRRHPNTTYRHLLQVSHTPAHASLCICDTSPHCLSLSYCCSKMCLARIICYGLV